MPSTFVPLLQAPVLVNVTRHCVRRCQRCKESTAFFSSPYMSLLCSILGGVFILAGLFLVTWGRNEADRLEKHAYRKLPVVVTDHSQLEPPLLSKRERKSP
jgi:hypothetical protein